ncbi:MAG: translation initiation factor IF-2 [Candidatus Bilamarchaeaceae archaeon]
MLIRSPIVCVLGHVDHGKTSILDSIRGSRVAAKEAGGITQMIGASYVKKEDIEEVAKDLRGKMNFNLKIPGLLFIDTPGHEAFTNLRDRGGSIADIAVLVVDIAQGFQPQTVESIRILRQYKTPFVVAANKIDLTSGWKEQGTTSFISSFSKQPSHVKEKLEEQIYVLMGKLSEHGFDCERFDRVTDFRKQVAIIPISAKTKEGLSELLMLLAGLSQKFLENKLEIDENGNGKGSILEVKEDKGLGTVVDVIVYDGVFKKGDEVIFLSMNGPKKTKIRSILLPNIKGGKEKYIQLEKVAAAAGVRLFAPGFEDAISGSPIETSVESTNEEKKFADLYKNIIFSKVDDGVVVKADSLGSLEALIRLLTDAKIPIRSAGIGKITKKDVLEAEVVAANDRYCGAVLGFNVYAMDDAIAEAQNKKIPLIISDIIYKVVENYQNWVVEEKDRSKKSIGEKLPWPAEIKILPGCCFRMCKPAIFGVKVLRGALKPGVKLMNAKGEIIGELREMQHEKTKLEKASRGMEIALSCDSLVLGKDAKEEDILYTYISKEEIDEWEKNLNILNDEEKQLLEEIKKIVLKPVW